MDCGPTRVSRIVARAASPRRVICCLLFQAHNRLAPAPERSGPSAVPGFSARAFLQEVSSDQGP